MTAVTEASFSTKKLAFFAIQAIQPGPTGPTKPNSKLSSAQLSKGPKVLSSC